MVALLPRDLEIFCVYLEGREMAGMLPLSWKWPRLTLKLHTRTLEIDGMQLEQVLIWKIRKLPILQDIQFKDGWEFLPILMTFLILQFQSISSKSSRKTRGFFPEIILELKRFKLLGIRYPQSLNFLSLPLSNVWYNNYSYLDPYLPKSNIYYYTQ